MARIQQDERGSVTSRFRRPSTDQLTSAEGNRVRSHENRRPLPDKGPTPATTIVDEILRNPGTSVLTLTSESNHGVRLYGKAKELILSPPTSAVRNTVGRGNEQVVKNSNMFASDAALREEKFKNPRSVTTFRVQNTKRKSGTRGRRSDRSRSMSGSPKHTSVFSRIRRDRSESPRHMPVGKERRDGGVFNRLGGKEKSVSAHSKSHYQSSRAGRMKSVPRKRHYKGTYSRRTEMLSESKDSGGGGDTGSQNQKSKGQALKRTTYHNLGPLKTLSSSCKGGTLDMPTAVDQPQVVTSKEHMSTKNMSSVEQNVVEIECDADITGHSKPVPIQPQVIKPKEHISNCTIDVPSVGKSVAQSECEATVIGHSKPLSFASMVKEKTRKTVKLTELTNEETIQGAHVAIPLAAVDEAEKDEITMVPIWVKLHNVPIVANQSKELNENRNLDDGFVEVTRRNRKGKLANKSRHVECIRLNKPKPNYLYRPVSKKSNGTSEASTSHFNIPKTNPSPNNNITNEKGGYVDVNPIKDPTTDMNKPEINIISTNSSFAALLETDEALDGPDDTWKTSTSVLGNIGQDSDSEEVENIIIDQPTFMGGRTKPNISKEASTPSGWNSDDVAVDIISQEDPVMHARVFFKADKKELFCSFIYAHNRYTHRRSLWRNLNIRKLYVRERPWCLLGDFNVALHLDDKAAGSSSIDIAMRDFQGVC
nr:RNA-directed DNA polymerase, eukaryota, reverse transcriptase zinc-binding domain protein [Tanacetum cinerariifolium]